MAAGRETCTVGKTFWGSACNTPEVYDDKAESAIPGNTGSESPRLWAGIALHAAAAAHRSVAGKG